MAMASERPNIVFILTDDQGCWAMGCAGNPEIRTPNLDRLAATGIRFENFFCASPVCSAARASILTGRMPSRHGVLDWIARGSMADANGPAIEYLRGQTAYTDILAANGYVCGLSGKWHLGDSMRPQKGFTHWFAHPQYMGNWKAYYREARMCSGGRLVDVPGYLTDGITDNAIGFLDAHKDGPQPFYLSVHYTAPHSPWVGVHPEEIVASYEDCAFASCPDVPAHPWKAAGHGGKGRKRRETLKGYFAAVTAMDTNVGRILDKLEADGLRDRTLVIFCSDNGMNMGHHGIYGKGNGTFPQNMYDTSVKVPAIISRPGQVPEGLVDDGLHSHYDLMPTLLEYVGLSNPQADELPGSSFAPLLRGESANGRETVVVFDEYGPVRMIRSRRWKYVHRYPYGPHELYDLAADPEEETNLFGAAETEEITRSMRAELTEYFNRYGDTEFDARAEAVYGRGQLDLVGPAGQGRKAFDDEIAYFDEEGRRRPADYWPADLYPFRAK